MDRSGPVATVPAGLVAARDDDRALLAAFTVGLVATALHPAGLAVGGALVGLLARSLRRAAVLGVEFGIAALVVWATLLVRDGTLLAVAGTWPQSGIAVGTALGVPTLAALAVRGVVRA